MPHKSSWHRRQDVARNVRHTCRLALFVAFATFYDGARCLGDDKSAPAATLLQEFGAGWDDTSWEPKYLRPVDDQGWSLRARTLSALARRGQEAGPSLREALKSGTVPARALAAQALGFLGDAASKEDLATAAEHDADAMVRLYAADSLGMLGGREHQSLLTRLESSEENRDVKRHLRYALDRDGAPVEASIVAQLRDWNPDHAATAKLGELAPDFTLTTVGGETITLSDYRGKSAVVLLFVYGDT